MTQFGFNAMLRLVSVLAASLTLTLPTIAQAAEPPFTDSSVSISARGQDVRDFVADLFGEAGLRAKVSTGVKGQVQGVFRGSPSEIWSTISRAYKLVAYWDGSIVRIYSNEEVGSRSIATYAPQRVVEQASSLGLSDSVNTVRAGDGMVFATGVPEYLARLETMAGSLGTQLAAVHPVPSKSPAGALASPLLRAPMARASVRSDVIREADGRSPFEVRIFYLTYRDAADRESRSADRLTIIPGVATLLQEQMGDGMRVGSVSSSAANEYSIRGPETVRGRGRPDEFGMRGSDEETSGERKPYLDGPRISADPANNAVIVRDRPETMGVYEKMIMNLDIEPLMVETQVTILELNVTKLEQLGFGFGFGIDSLAALFGGGLNFDTGGFTGGYLSGDGGLFLARIEALKRRGAMRVVTRQSLSTINNQVATFDIAAQQLVPLVGEREVDAVPINYGLGLRVRPSAIEDGGEMRIRMQLEVTDTARSEEEVNGVPTTAGAQLATHMIVRQGESVMLGGMTSTRTFDRRNRTPILGDIPILGEIFNSRRKGQDRVERLFLLTPRVTNLGGSRVAGQQPAYTLEQLQGTEPLAEGRP